MDKKVNLKKEIFQWSITLAGAVILSFSIRTYVFAKADVIGPSMMPTLNDKDNMYVEKLSGINDNYKKGQIVIFDSENSNHDLYVKRVIATAGDEVELSNGKVYVNDQEINEPYLSKNTVTTGKNFLQDNKKLKIEKGFVFLLGDNREVSYDSRYFGPVSVDRIKGHVILRVYPFNQIRTFN